MMKVYVKLFAVMILCIILISIIYLYVLYVNNTSDQADEIKNPDITVNSAAEPPNNDYEGVPAPIIKIRYKFCKELEKSETVKIVSEKEPAGKITNREKRVWTVNDTEYSVSPDSDVYLSKYELVIVDRSSGDDPVGFLFEAQGQIEPSELNDPQAKQLPFLYVPYFREKVSDDLDIHYTKYIGKVVSSDINSESCTITSNISIRNINNEFTDTAGADVFLTDNGVIMICSHNSMQYIFRFREYSFFEYYLN